LKAGGLRADQAHRVRMERESIPKINMDDYAAVIVGGGPSDVSTDPAKKSATQTRFERELHQLLDEVEVEADSARGISPLIRCMCSTRNQLIPTSTFQSLWFTAVV